MKKVPRWYQKRGASLTLKDIENDKACHPIIAVPTGGGKSLMLCMLASSYLNKNIKKSVLVLSHRSTILRQDHNALIEYFDGLEIGLYSAKLESKTICKITVASIASVFRKPELFTTAGLIVIDEAHLVNNKRVGMYRKLLEQLPDANCVGLTATPFRLGQGYIYDSKTSLFTKCSFDITSTKNYNRLVGQGYLSPMYSFATKLNLDTSEIKKRNSDFLLRDLSMSFDQYDITQAACLEFTVFFRTRKLKKCLVFAIDIEHADHITNEIIKLGYSAVSIHSRTPLVLTKLKKYKRGEYDFCVGVDMLTTGLDIPEIDFLVLLRPTDSPSYHVQMLGRGGRPFFMAGYDITKRSQRLKAIAKGGKPFCSVMDFAGNLERLGPINNVDVEPARDSDGTGEAVMKTCPKCDCRSYGAVRVCSQCGHKFVFKTRLETVSRESSVIKPKKVDPAKIEDFPADTAKLFWRKIDTVVYQIHTTGTGIPAMKVVYMCQGKIFNEFVCLDHGGYAKFLARKWIKERVPRSESLPYSVKKLFYMKELLKKPDFICIEKDGKWDKIKSCVFNK